MMASTERRMVFLLDDEGIAWRGQNVDEGDKGAREDRTCGGLG